MNYRHTNLKNCLLIEPDIFSDDRGFFMETYNSKKYLEIGVGLGFVQDNFSYSYKNVLRGLHLQINEPQGKLVSVYHGEVYDVVVDLREDSPSFKKWQGFYLSHTNNKQLWVPPGFAHGFLVTSDYAYFSYKCSEFYNYNDEACIVWNDPDLNIEWPVINPIVSEKDMNGKLLKDFLK
jgi:dTDP-4-dehydrorhamnose 3,5-epimerase